MTTTEPDDPTEVVIEFPADVRVFDETDDDLGGPTDADMNGDQTGGMGPL